MKNLLPRVDPSVGGSLEHELANKADKVYIQEQLAIIKEENPVISFWIENFSKKTFTNIMRLCALSFLYYIFIPLFLQIL